MAGRRRPESEVTLSEEQINLQARWELHKANGNADGLDTTDIGPYLRGIIGITSQFMEDETASDDLRDQARQLNAGAKAVAVYLDGSEKDAFKAGFVTGMIWEQFQFHAGILAEAVRKHSDSVYGHRTGLEKRRATRNDIKAAAKRYIGKGRTDVLDQLERDFPEISRRTLADILREARKELKGR